VFDEDLLAEVILFNLPSNFKPCPGKGQIKPANPAE
jgi:hypothetical protein